MGTKRTQKIPPKRLPSLDIILNKEQEVGYDKIRNSTLTYIDGKAGSGKTLLALYAALNSLHGCEIDTIFITRPYVTTEEWGFLPGDIKEKMDPILLPIYDNLLKIYPDRHQNKGVSKISQYIDDGDIEIAPIGFMRGRTFCNSYVILDEAQNITIEQLKMAVTRIGKGTKMIICGDLNQCDLKRIEDSGILLLNKVIERNNVNSISSIFLKENHRDPIVKELLDEFDSISL
jgi:phosphate starvation-inducible PhoH-like protein